MCDSYNHGLLVKSNSPFFGMKYYLDVEKCFGVAIVAPSVNHILPTISVVMGYLGILYLVIYNV